MLHEKGMSCSMIARELGGGITRNAVIGKIHRMGLSYRPTTARFSKPRVKAARRAKKAGIVRARSWLKIVAGPFTEPTPLPLPFVTDVARVGLLDLEPHHCRWVVGEPAEMRFCGCQKVPGLPYCSGHAARAFRAPTMPGDRVFNKFNDTATVLKYAPPVSPADRDEVLA